MTATYINPKLPSMIRDLYRADLRERSIQNMLDLAADLVQELIDLRAAEPAVTDGGVRAALRVWYRGAWGGGWTPEHESRMRGALEAALSTERGE